MHADVSVFKWKKYRNALVWRWFYLLLSANNDSMNNDAKETLFCTNSSEILQQKPVFIL